MRWTGLLGLTSIVAACANGQATTAEATPSPSDGTDAAVPATVAPDAAPPNVTPDAAVTPDTDASPPLDASTSFACAQTFDFESTDGSFTHVPLDGASGGAFDAWSWGAASAAPSCHSGTKCFATNLAGPYAQCQRAELRSPVIDLSSCATAGTLQVTFWHAYDFLGYTDASGAAFYDGGIVEMSGDGGATWTQAVLSPPSVGNVAIAPRRGVFGQYACPGPKTFHVDAQSGFINASSGWQAVEADVPAALRTRQFMVRFAYSSGKSTADNALVVKKPGWHIDDVAIVAR